MTINELFYLNAGNFGLERVVGREVGEVVQIKPEAALAGGKPRRISRSLQLVGSWTREDFGKMDSKVNRPGFMDFRDSSSRERSALVTQDEARSRNVRPRTRRGIPVRGAQPRAQQVLATEDIQRPIFPMVCVGTGAHHGASSRYRCRPGASVRVDARLIAALGHPPRPLVFITGYATPARFEAIDPDVV